jgi:hypothetical protein
LIDTQNMFPWMPTSAEVDRGSVGLGCILTTALLAHLSYQKAQFHDRKFAQIKTLMYDLHGSAQLKFAAQPTSKGEDKIAVRS